MYKKINKKTRGFSLVELMVVVAIMGTLAAIAIPAYNEYRKSAKKAAYRSDLNALHKGWLAFGVELDSFCERETDPEEATIANVGMKSLTSSNLYGSNPGKNNFLGFGAIACGTLTTPVANDHFINQSSTDAHCNLGITEYDMGVFGHLGGINYYRAEIDQNGVVDDGDTQRTGSPLPSLVAGDGDETCDT